MPDRWDAPADPQMLERVLAVPRIGDIARPPAVLKTEPEDFRVTEIPAYETCGHGAHLFLEIEKRDLPHERLIDLLARTLGVKKADVGKAGMKDRRAVTRQFVSVPAEAQDRLDRIASLRLDDGSDLKVVATDRHTNKLKTGHLRGNRFEIVARTPEPVCVAAWGELNETVATVRATGFPNAFGPQRFGDRGSTLALGLSLVKGESDVRDIPPRRRRFLVRLALSAAQSAVFNTVLARRLRDGTAATARPGDVVCKRPQGKPFAATDVAEANLRIEAGEWAVTGPLPGPKMVRPAGEAEEEEAGALASLGLTADDFKRFAKLAPGARRPLTVLPEGLEIARDEAGLRFSFSLPAGSYATTLLEQFVETGSAS